MYIKIKQGSIEKYPYSLDSFRKDFSNMSIPKNVSDVTLARFGVYKVKQTNTPDFDYTKNIIEKTPESIDGTWTQIWGVVDASEKEIEDRTAVQVAFIKEQRNKLLSNSDWTQVTDAPVDSTVWATYRQALRDVPAQEGFPWSVTWPTQPE